MKTRIWNVEANLFRFKIKQVKISEFENIHSGETEPSMLVINNSKQLSQKAEQVVGPGLLEGGLPTGADRTAAQSPGGEAHPGCPLPGSAPHCHGVPHGHSTGHKRQLLSAHAGYTPHTPPGTPACQGLCCWGRS